jgi:hypothetical protein
MPRYDRPLYPTPERDLKKVSNDAYGQVVHSNPDRSSCISTRLEPIVSEDEEDSFSDSRNHAQNFNRRTTPSMLPSVRTHLQRKQKMALPMIIGKEVVLTMPDSGCQENVASLDFVQKCNLEINSTMDQSSIKEFQMANGKMTKAIGQVIAPQIRFANDPCQNLTCVFYVMEKLIMPVIMGMSFLQEREVLSKNRHLLSPRFMEQGSLYKVCSLNNPKQRLLCYLNSKPVSVNADTGSEVDLISLDYALQEGISVLQIPDEFHHTVQFADESCSELIGMVILEVSFGSPHGPRYEIEFYVLEGLTCDVLLGEDILNEIDAFQNYGDDLHMQDGLCEPSEMNPIVWLNSVEHAILKPFKMLSRGKYSTT